MLRKAFQIGINQNYQRFANKQGPIFPGYFVLGLYIKLSLVPVSYFTGKSLVC
jgi:hypothetical protein